MEELRHALHAAADDPPPTRIDLDQLIDGTRRRSRLQYRVGTVAGATALAAGAVLVPTVLLPAGGLGTAGGGGGAPPRRCATTPPPMVVPSGSIGVVAGPTWDPSVPESSRNPGPRATYVASSSPAPTYSGTPPADADGVASYQEVNPPSDCGMPVPLRQCAVAPVSAVPPSAEPGSSGSDSPGMVSDCVEYSLASAAALTTAVHDAMPGWNHLTLGANLGATPPSDRGYDIGVELTNGTSMVIIEIRVERAERGDPMAQCARLRPAGRSHANCVLQHEGDAVQTWEPVGTSPGTAVDVRPDGTVVTIIGPKPLTLAELVAIARSPKLPTRL